MDIVLVALDRLREGQIRNGETLRDIRRTQRDIIHLLESNARQAIVAPPPLPSPPMKSSSFYSAVVANLGSRMIAEIIGAAVIASMMWKGVDPLEIAKMAQALFSK